MKSPRSIALSYAGYSHDTDTSRQIITVPGANIVAIRAHAGQAPAIRSRWNVLAIGDLLMRKEPWYLSEGSVKQIFQPAQESPLPTVLAVTSDELLAMEHGTFPVPLARTLPTPPISPVRTALTAAAFPGDSDGGLVERVATFTELAIKDPASLQGFLPLTASGATEQVDIVPASRLHLAEFDYDFAVSIS